MTLLTFQETMAEIPAVAVIPISGSGLPEVGFSGIPEISGVVHSQVK